MNRKQRRTSASIERKFPDFMKRRRIENHFYQNSLDKRKALEKRVRETRLRTLKRKGII